MKAHDANVSCHMTTSPHAVYASGWLEVSTPHTAQISPAVKVLTYLSFALNLG